MKLTHILALLPLAACASPTPLEDREVVDLTYPFDETTVIWPTATQPFELEVVDAGRDRAGRWYAANNFRTAEHGGTHLDAPLHFAEGHLAAADIPVDRLIAPARVIDVREACSENRDYRVGAHDILLHEGYHGEIEPGSAVLILTGWGQYYRDPETYLGMTDRGGADDLHFPGISPGAAHLLISRGVHLVGIDTASLDHGPSKDFGAHRLLAEANVPGLENLAHLESIPLVGATLVALPMKIGGGTGGPCRVVAILP